MNDFLEIMSIDINTLTNEQKIAYAEWKERAIKFLNARKTVEHDKHFKLYYDLGVANKWMKCCDLRIKGFGC